VDSTHGPVGSHSVTDGGRSRRKSPLPRPSRAAFGRGWAGIARPVTLGRNRLRCSPALLLDVERTPAPALFPDPHAPAPTAIRGLARRPSACWRVLPRRRTGMTSRRRHHHHQAGTCPRWELDCTDGPGSARQAGSTSSFSQRIHSGVEGAPSQPADPPPHPFTRQACAGGAAGEWEGTGNEWWGARTESTGWLQRAVGRGTPSADPAGALLPRPRPGSEVVVLVEVAPLVLEVHLGPSLEVEVIQDQHPPPHPVPASPPPPPPPPNASTRALPPPLGYPFASLHAHQRRDGTTGHDEEWEGR
jgi:hypothetical protein